MFNYLTILAEEAGTDSTNITGMDTMGSIYSIGILIVMFVVFYFILIRPQRKRDKELKKELETLCVGDKVVTIGGLVGFVANIKDDEITISTSAANSLVTFTKSAIQTVVKRDNLNPDGSVKKEPETEKKSFFGSKKKEDKPE